MRRSHSATRLAHLTLRGLDLGKRGNTGDLAVKVLLGALQLTKRLA
jgi:hypothetical protein